MIKMENKKQFKDLKITDLRRELGKRKLDTKGNKVTLEERLREALRSEGIDVEKYYFDIEHGDGAEETEPQMDTNQMLMQLMRQITEDEKKDKRKN